MEDMLAAFAASTRIAPPEAPLRTRAAHIAPPEGALLVLDGGAIASGHGEHDEHRPDRAADDKMGDAYALSHSGEDVTRADQDLQAVQPEQRVRAAPQPLAGLAHLVHVQEDPPDRDAAEEHRQAMQPVD